MNQKLMSYKGYQGSAEVSLDDNCLHGKIVNIKDLVTYEADSVAALREAFGSAVDLYVARCAELNLSADHAADVERGLA